MKQRAQITVQKAENGYSINFATDEMGKNRKLIAKDEAEVKQLVTSIVNDDLFAVAESPKPATATPTSS